MTDQELDRIMRRVLIDSMKLEEKGEDNGPVFEPSLRHRRRMRATEVLGKDGGVEYCDGDDLDFIPDEDCCAED